MIIKKIHLFLVLLSPALLLVFNGCQQAQTSPYLYVQGEAQGTTYTVVYIDEEKRDISAELIEILKDVDLSLSTYRPDSYISKWNQNEAPDTLDRHFKTMIELSATLHQLSAGYFDPTIEPLSQFYGFEKQQAHPNQNIDSILSYVGFSKLDIQAHQILKKDQRMQLNFNAIAQGYTVDLMAEFLISKGIKNFFVELGGEVYMSGKKANQQKWTVGIEKPEAERVDSFQDKVYLSDFAITTSGSYRKWKINQENGKKISHTINPKTGQNQVKTLVSASIINPNCALADGLSTVLMNFDKTQAEDFLSKHPFPALLIFSEDGKTTVNYYNGFQNFMTP
ncbi:MAG: FAD:protein FMN transferase [Flavobacteriales bacterium]